MKKSFLYFSFLLASASIYAQSLVLDPSFQPAPSFDYEVASFHVQQDGKIILTGGYYDGIRANGPVRLNHDGTIDTTFKIGSGFAAAFGSSESTTSSVLQPDGKIVVGGYFTSYRGTPAKKLVRINPDGTVDTTFKTGNGFVNKLQSGFEVLAIVQCVSLQADGKILVGGRFTEYDGNPVGKMVRLNPDGSFDNSFNTGTGFNHTTCASCNFVSTITPLNNGKIMVGGYFDSYDGTSISKIVRLNANGTLDTTFKTGTGFNEGTPITGYTHVGAILVQNDGKILAGGRFANYNGVNKENIIRLNNDGTIDNSFNCTLDNAIANLKVVDNGKIWIAGGFTEINGKTRNRIALLNPDGSLDTALNIGSGFDDWGTYMAIQNDGKVLVSGYFTKYNGKSVNHIVRLVNCATFDTILTTTACNSYTFNGQTYTSSGTYTHSFINALGCDSTVTLNLTIRPNISVSQNGNMLTANANPANATFQWINCNDTLNPILQGETAQSFTATANGRYAVIVTENGCTATSNCFDVTVTAINSISHPVELSIYPNPSSGIFVLNSNANLRGSVVKVISLTGQAVYENHITTIGNSHIIDLHSQPSGFYLIELKDDLGFNRYKVFKY